MNLENIIQVAIGVISGGTLSTILFIGLNKRKKVSEVRDAEIDTSEKESIVNAKRAERAWDRADKLEDRIDELIKEIDNLKDELIKVKLELNKVTSEKIEIDGKYNRLKKKVLIECKCLEINWEEY